jgi:hypothetical protein
MRKREGTALGEILNEDEREIGWVKEIWKRRERTESERCGAIRKKSKKKLNLSNQTNSPE